jgi:hypothetical protein
MKFFSRHKSEIFFCGVVVFLILFFVFLPKLSSQHFVFGSAEVANVSTGSVITATTSKVFFPDYIATPDPVKGIYMTSWIASSAKLREPLIDLIDTTELNAVVIDIKDYSGNIFFPITDPKLLAYGSEDIRVPDMQSFVAELHQKGIYTIARIAVFQDAYFVKARPDLAVKNLAGTAVWKDDKGISWIDPGSREYWNYIVLLTRAARAIGFDEVNFDYIRYPSDGNLQDISYPFSTSTPKAEVLREFFSYLHDQLAENDGTPEGDEPAGSEPAGEVPKGANTKLKISADLFGMTTTAKDDMGIGQVLEDALPYFDYVSPMVYPSHYATNFDGYKNPEQYPYQVVQYAMQSAVSREKALASSTGDFASTTEKLRPWLQDFGLTMDYGPTQVRDQIQAVYDDGLSSWLLWSASNKYTVGALDAK